MFAMIQIGLRKISIIKLSL